MANPRGFNHRVIIDNCHIQVWHVDRHTNALGNQIDDIPINKSTAIKHQPVYNMVQVSRISGDYRGFIIEQLESIVDGTGTPIAGVTDAATFYAFITNLRDNNCCDGCV